MFGTRQTGPVVWGLLLLILAGCSAPQTRQALLQASDLPLQAAVADVPFYPQQEYYCGPASLAMMLSWAGIPSGQDEIARQIYTPGRQGTLPLDILAGARRNGALAIEVTSLQDMLAEIAAGHPVLVFQNLGLDLWPKWHFAVAVGYDLTEENLLLHSGIDPQRIHNLNAFEKTWQRADYWAITVTPPDQLPARANELASLKAAAGLERAEQYAAALSAYQAISTRWSNSTIARMGLGNTRYKLGQYTQAAVAFLDVIRIDNAYAPAWNNLANALVKQGLNEEAIEAARKAVTLDGNNELYRDTLDEITDSQQQNSPKLFF